MRGELARLHQRLETTIVYVTHDQIEAMTLADRIVVMNNGIIMQTGAPMEVYENPKNLFVAGFIGSPAMNFFDARVTGEKGALFVEGENFRLAISDKLQDRFMQAKDRDLILGIRPEHIYDKDVKGNFPGGEILKATVEVVEPIGSQVILLASCGSSNLTACVDPQTHAKPNRELEFVVDTNRLHLFDKMTEKAY
jgi:multiple sugar transport system ATP-binding protein